MARQHGAASSVHCARSTGCRHHHDRAKSKQRIHRPICQSQFQRSGYVGGPALTVVPEAVDWLDLRNVLIAWKDAPEARRAIVDSLPLLHKAKNVTVVEIIEDGGSRDGASKRTADVVAWLSRHGIVASALVPEQDKEGNAAVTLDRTASNVGAGVVVAGAYGHSQLREWVLGGVTQHLATEATRCVLLSR